MTAERTIRVGIILAGVLGAIALVGGTPAKATEPSSDTLNVASLEQLPESAMRDERGGALVTSKLNIIFSLHALVKVKDDVKFQKDIAASGSQSQTTSQISNTTVTQTNSANLSTGPSISFNVVVGP